ncbi:MAG: hypothetical protein KC646_06825 [Candidatus Cloacimonetes bacterium]|nr:hypothetical protein [Candidatus Cloacimonadota bacterium]
MEKLSSFTHFILQSAMVLLLLGGVLNSVGIIDFGLKDFWVAKENSSKDEVPPKKDKLTDKQVKSSDKPSKIKPTNPDIEVPVKKDLTTDLGSVKKMKSSSKSEN